ncbi:BTAD domain-containing putative transcriptional regulator [Microtetraspora malaysiensis]|uniref:BTAD domain-containing putative transcriptional regulator n=1 Tax=Microtetraspora malaysiensis TaxID=161358 RepID=UPI003D8F1B0E
MADRQQGGSLVEVRVLGALEVQVDGVPVRLTGHRAPGLLALLTLRPGRVVNTAEVLRQVWHERASESPRETARNAVQARISALRRAIGSATFRTTESGYVLDVPAESVDAVRFDSTIRRARALRAAGRTDEAGAAYLEAFALWRGETAYEGLHHVAALAQESKRLSELRLQALQEAFALYIAAGRYEEIADQLLDATRRHRDVEELWALRMIGLNGQGRQAEALAVFAEAREHLRRQFGLDPGPRLRELEGQILRQETPAGGGVRFLGPPRISRPATSFVGRQNELPIIVDLLTTGRLLTIIGPGGVGKTRLALEAAQLLVDSCARLVAHGVTVIDLVGYRGGDDLARAVMDSLGIVTSGTLRENMPRRGARTVDALCDLLSDRSMLLVMDNCEHLIDDVADLVATLQASTDAITVLATSREPLGIPGETIYTVHPLAVPPEDAESDELLREVPAVRLFLDRALAVHPAPEVDPAHLRRIARVCGQLDGLPLAVELAAVRARLLGIDEVVRHLDNRFQLSSQGLRTVADRHRTLGAVLDWSYDLLDIRDRKAFAVLSVFRGSFSMKQAQKVWVRLGGTEQNAFDSIERLATRSMVQIETAVEKPVRFRLLETMRTYGADKLRQLREERASFLSHAQIYASLAREYADALKTEHQARAVSAMTLDDANIRAALARSIELGEGSIAQEIVGALGYIMWMRGGHGSVWEMAVRAIELPGGDAAVRMRALAWVTHLGSLLGYLEEAVAHGEEATHLAAMNPDRRMPEFGFALLARAHALHRLGRGEEGDAVLREAWRVASSEDDHWSMAGCGMVGGLHALTRGSLEEAELRFIQAMDHYRACGDRWGQQRAALRRAVVFEARGDYAGAARLLMEALKFIEDLDLAEVAAPAKAALARATLLAGDPQAARQIVHGLERQGIAGRFAEVAARLDQCRAVLAERDGRAADAIDGHITAARRLADTGLTVEALESWARVATLARPGTRQALMAAEACQATARRIPDPRLQAIALEVHAMSLTHDAPAYRFTMNAAADLRRTHRLARPALLRRDL